MLELGGGSAWYEAPLLILCVPLPIITIGTVGTSLFLGYFQKENHGYIVCTFFISIEILFFFFYTKTINDIL